MGMENVKVMSFDVGGEGDTLSTNFLYFHVFSAITVVAMACAPSADEASGTIDLNDDGTGVIEAVACATRITPGTWKSTAVDETSTNDPVIIAAGSICSFDANSFSANIRATVQIWYLPGSIGS